ncbi:DUF3324 domain-containing protein [Lactobacillus curvatus]|nr:DUF3324 domain-containing protein [Latilactobacillus curvatus]MSE24544.1 DUF3324 domain-containing protein [Latilactobacillus curvatus]
MQKYRRWLLIIMTTVCLTLILGSGAVQAAKKKTTTIPAENKATFMIMPELPTDNLSSAKAGYFNLHLKKHQKKTVRIKVYNPTNQAINIYGQVKDATTNDDATIDYLGTQKIDTQLLKHPGSELVSVPKKTVLPVGATKWITIKINNQSNFRGIKATAINLSATQFNQSSAVKNAYRYAIGLILNGQSLPSKDYQYLQSPRIKTRFVANRKAAISIRLNNPDPMYLQKAKMQVTLKNQKWHFIKYERTLKNGKIAPNSSFYLNLLLGGKRLVPGTYKMKLHIASKQYTKNINKYVVITKSQARYINRYNAAYQLYRNWILGSGLVVILIGSWIGFKVLRRKRDSNAKND